MKPATIFKPIICALALMLCIGAAPVQVKASTGESLIVNAAWLDGDIIRIDISDPQTGLDSSLAVPLSDYITDGDNSQFISVQAVDLNGNQSDIVEIKNPYYDPTIQAGTAENISAISGTNEQLQAFTPEGSGTVIDNTDEAYGKEFFTINSEDGNEFYLIIDRQRNADNVYFLNAVTEEDLMSLAEKNGRTIEASQSAVQEPAPIAQPQPIESEPNAPEIVENNKPSALAKIGSNLLILGGIAAVAGGVLYYIKVVQPKKSVYNTDFNDDGDMDYDDDFDDGGDM